MNAGSKKLNEMNRLGDMGHFPVPVNVGATLTVLVTLVATWWIEPRLSGGWAPTAWVALILVLNLLPVVALRLTLNATSSYPPLAEMNFWRDQHKFSDWVYVAASANMAFWVLLGWAVFAAWHTVAALGALLVVALAATLSPVLLRAIRR